MRVERRERLRHTMIVMQDVQRQLFTDSVRAEIRLSASRSGVGGGKLSDAEVDQVLSEFDLLSCAEQHPLALSGGQQQRLVIATAVDQDARVIVLDEPTSGVDYRHLLTIAAELRSLADEGRVVVVISHDIEFLNECADHVIEIT